MKLVGSFLSFFSQIKLEVFVDISLENFCMSFEKVKLMVKTEADFQFIQTVSGLTLV